ncbi:hypothetical protein [Clostridium cellulovorans]|uniref:Uncharacterized protein n=1 Tax=Clostridium cellulovorans (strain ATCC 35296 / DSM 3052 / OCM 3 / 743B) TaxID=573061 RepID=D9SQ21_CLOC7|nr:hypothetical protein [Clostridium cellulovorans]ADL52157.1 hypothetical protein Clocel_2444 [Clostridium cellulovorans 743B]
MALIENVSFIKEVIRRIDDRNHNVVLFDEATEERILIDDGLKDRIKKYYEDKMLAMKIREEI